MSGAIGRLLLAGPALAAIYLLLIPEPEVGDIAWAAVVAGAVLWLSGVGAPEADAAADRPARPVARDLAGVPRFAFHVICTAVRGTWAVALISLGLRPIAGPGFVTLPIGGRSLRESALVGLAVTLSPGSVLVDIDEEAGTMIFHVIGQTEEEFRADVDTLWDALGPMVAGGS